MSTGRSLVSPHLAWRLIVLVLCAFSMALSLAHLMEMPPRLRWDASLWMGATNFGGLYYLFGRVGAVIDLGAILAAAMLAFGLRRRPAAAPRFTAVGAALFVCGLIVWSLGVAPANAVMADWREGVVPPDFAAVRDRWEYSHASIAVLKIAGFISVACGCLLADAPFEAPEVEGKREAPEASSGP